MLFRFLLLVFVILNVAPTTATVPWTLDPSLSDVFVGPFPSWPNVKTNFGAKGDGVTDDTAAFQRALNNYTSFTTIYVPAGTYMITGLVMYAKDHIGFTGEHPSTTTIRMLKPNPGCTQMDDENGACNMMWAFGCNGNTFQRITWDGNNMVSAVLHSEWMNTTGGYAGRGHIVENVFKNARYGLRLGNAAECSNGNCATAEYFIARNQFENLSVAGSSIEGANVLDHDFFWNRFVNCNEGITNCNGYGNYHVIGNVFFNSTVADMCVNCNFNGIRDNYAYQSPSFVRGLNNACSSNLVISNNTVELKAVATQFTYSQEQVTYVLTDNKFIFLNKNLSLPLNQYYTCCPSWRGFMFSMGNTFVFAGASAVVARNESVLFNFSKIGPITNGQPVAWYNGYVIEFDKNYLEPSAFHYPSSVVMPGVRNALSGSHVFYLDTANSNGTLQALVNKSVAYQGHRPVIYLLPGSHGITQSVIIPAGLDVFIEGDMASIISAGSVGLNVPAFILLGPSKATFSNVRVDCSYQCKLFQIVNADQVGARIYSEEFDIWSYVGDYNVILNGTDHVKWDGLSYWASGLATGTTGMHIGGPCLASGQGPANGRFAAFSGAGGGGGLKSYWDVRKGGRVYSGSTWYEQECANCSWAYWDQDTEGDIAYFSGSAGYNNPFYATNTKGTITLLGTRGTPFVVNAGKDTNVLVMGAYLAGVQQAEQPNWQGGNVALDAILNNDLNVQLDHMGTVSQQNESWYRNSLKFYRSVFMQPVGLISSKPASVTDARFYRVSGQSYQRAMEVIGSNSTICMPEVSVAVMPKATLFCVQSMLILLGLIAVSN